MFARATELLLLYTPKTLDSSKSYFLGHFCFLRAYDVEPKYYADGEDAFAMKKDLRSFWEKV